MFVVICHLPAFQFTGSPAMARHRFNQCVALGVAAVLMGPEGELARCWMGDVDGAMAA